MNNLLQDYMYDEMIKLFFDPGNISRTSIIIALGNLFLEQGGKNREIEYFLRSLMIGNDNKLELALANAENPAEKKRLSGEILENCYAFLEPCRESLDGGTVCVLNWFKDHPPYPGFIKAVKDKIRFSGMEKVVASSRNQPSAIRALLRSEEKAYAST